jgi:hypothetical protein
MRILVVNPTLIRLSNLGACEQDRLQNVNDLVRLGHEVRVVTGQMPYQQHWEVERFYAERNMRTTIVTPTSERWRPTRFTQFAYLDGATWEYAQPHFVKTAKQAIMDWKPDLVWCHATYNWASAAVARQHRIATVIRSVNYEAETVLHELGSSALNRFRARVKRASERTALRTACVLVAITPDEQHIYQQIDSHASVALLPLRALPKLLRPARSARNACPLRVFFMGSTYSVPHNVAALRFIVEQLMPRLRQAAPNAFEIHIMGSKVPAALSGMAAPDLIFDGYVPDLDAHLEKMDIALAPSLYGTGMQQKVFEPLCRGFPMVTHARALAGYDFLDGVHLFTAEDAEGYVQHLLQLREPTLRAQLSAAASAQAIQLFNPARYDHDVKAILDRAAQASH